MILLLSWYDIMTALMLLLNDIITAQVLLLPDTQQDLACDALYPSLTTLEAGH